MSDSIFEVSVETSFSASHQVRSADGEVELLHGHNFRVEASVACTDLDSSGMVLDFLELEALLGKILAPYDHRHLNELAPFDELNPSTENIARFVFHELRKRLEPRGLTTCRVRVWEAPNFSASYRES